MESLDVWERAGGIYERLVRTSYHEVLGLLSDLKQAISLRPMQMQEECAYRQSEELKLCRNLRQDAVM